MPSLEFCAKAVAFWKVPKPTVSIGDDDGIGAGRDGVFHQPLAIIRRIFAVRVDADEVVEVVAKGRDGEIDGRALDFLRVVEQR